MADQSTVTGAIGASDELDQLEASVMGLRPRLNLHMDGPLPRKEIRVSATRGRHLFHHEDVGCIRRHHGPHLTISGRSARSRIYDVGTGIKADVPSFRSLWYSAPYLHDGRAQSLRDVITIHNASNRHGHTGHLSKNAQNDLSNSLLASFTTPSLNRIRDDSPSSERSHLD